MFQRKDSFHLCYRIFNSFLSRFTVLGKITPKKITIQEQLASEQDQIKIDTNKPKQLTSQNLELLDTLYTIPSFRAGVQYATQQQFQLVEVSFKETLQTLQEKYPNRIDLESLLMKKMLPIKKILNKNTELTDILEKLYFYHYCYYKFTHIPELFGILRNLLTHYCIYDIDRGLLFIDNIMQETSSSNTQIPKGCIKLLKIYKAILFNLKSEENQQSVEQYQNCLSQGIGSVLKGIILNNLAVSKQWHLISKLNKQRVILEKFILGETSQTQDKDLKPLDTKTEIQEIIKLYKRALLAFEFEDKERQTDQLNEKQFMSARKLCDPNIEKIDDDVEPKDIVLKQTMSYVVAMNLGELFFYSNQIKNSQFWLQVALNLVQQNQDIGRVLRALVFSANIHYKLDNQDFAEQLYIDCLESSKNYLTYNKLFCLSNYCQFLEQKKRNYEVFHYSEQMKEIEKKILYWDDKKENLIIPDYNFDF